MRTRLGSMLKYSADAAAHAGQHSALIQSVQFFRLIHNFVLLQMIHSLS